MFVSPVQNRYSSKLFSRIFAYLSTLDSNGGTKTSMLIPAREQLLPLRSKPRFRVRSRLMEWRHLFLSDATISMEKTCTQSFLPNDDHRIEIRIDLLFSFPNL
jgi:hypothetical protein